MKRVLAPLLRLLLSLLPCLLASLLPASYALQASEAAPPALASQQASAKRDAWQRPQEVMDGLGIQAGQVVADVGTGDGYFAFHLAARVGPQGKVYAQDIDKRALERIRRRAERDGLEQIETLLGAPDNPRLPTASLDAALIVDAYHEMRDYDAMLAGLFRALRPGGRLGLIDSEDDPGRPRERYYNRHRIPAELVREDAARAGFRFLRQEPGFVRPRDKKAFYFLVFEKPAQ